MQEQNRDTVIRILKQEAPYLRTHFGVTEIALFGSFAKNEADNKSDIDIIVSLSKPLGFAFIELADFLEDKLGRKIDLITDMTLESGINDPRKAHIAKNIKESLIYV